MKSNIANIWANQFTNSNIGVVIDRVEDLPQFNCYIGTILASKAKLFSLKLPKDFKSGQIYLKRFTGVEIQMLPSNELIIILQENDLTDIFIMFIEDIIKSISILSTHDDAILRISQRVTFWKRLFGKFTGGLLTELQQRGLYGELLILESFLKETKNHSKVIDAWQAPTGTNQDFYFGKTAIEVKTTKLNHPTIKISNEFQLDSTFFENLYICFIRLSEWPNGKDTLLNKIKEIRNILKSTPFLTNDFNQKLSCLGISSDLENEYDKLSYTIRTITCYLVTDGFPRIISSMLYNGVSHVSYEISPDECSEFEFEFEKILKSICE